MANILNLLRQPQEGKKEILGWVRTNRDNGKLGFIAINDGTCFETIQIVYKADKISNFDEAKKIKTGSAIRVKGELLLTPNAKQTFEIQATEVEVLADCDDSYPLQKKRHTNEFLREIAHIRPRGNTFNAAFRMRSKISFYIHQYFQNKDFVYVHSPIITSNDGEGAGEAFTVTTRTDGNYEKDFYRTHATLGVTGQLQGEAFAQAFKKIYTFAPTFRAENSNTTRHASEFWMVEPEVAFNDLTANMDLADDVIRYVVKKCLEENKTEMDFFDKWISKGVIQRLENFLSTGSKRLSYTEVIEILKKAVAAGHKFENTDIQWGMDLNTEHERYICEIWTHGPVFVHDYPEGIKAFYMKQNDDGKTVAACDMLVPGIGELIGGSEREADYNKIYDRCVKMGVPTEELSWYLELRKFGYYKSSGFGIGLDRLIMYVTGIENIRDVIPFPRTSNKMMF